MPHPYLVGQPCQVAVNDKLCGEPSLFLYFGLVPEGLTPKELKRRGQPLTMLMCPDHAMRLARDFAWPIKDGKTKIERLDVTKLRYRCKNCLISINFEWDQTVHMSTNPGELRYCPRCGQATSGIAMPNPEHDYVDWIAEQFEGMPRQLIELLYQDWDRRKFRTFREFVEHEIKTFDETGELSVD